MVQLPLDILDLQNVLKQSVLHTMQLPKNVAYNQGYTDPATTAVQGWLKSPGHLTNIKGNYEKTGIGIATTSKGKVFLTQIFLR
ncbi:hypothetical protein ANSO36C_57340 [Nostoc cf. commune SO-36]|uniref:SCP domain-containing protein n=1 Tax=Nostoc cf. commune SO-36 TaxID=449208 RepID=A0ABM7Z9K8_NOSCO|nr:hypothetical protein ANSO36C_57340 [Nostoc cf. commune SO-36]